MYASTTRTYKGGNEPKHHSDAETAYLTLRQMVVTGELPPGLVINEQDLVSRLNIGRTPVREAIQRLAAVHLLIVFPRRGVAIAKIDLADIQAIFEEREAVETKIAELAAFRHTDEEADSIAALGVLLKEAAVEQEYRRFLALDHEFHRALASSARSRFLAETCDHVLVLSEWIWHQFFRLNGTRPTDFFGHNEIIEAIVERDVERAGREMREHINRSRDLVRGAM
jgi:DNA-binding GntR family transcriptional regulator